MFEKNTKVVFIDKSIIDNNIYTIIDGAFDYNTNKINYIIEGRKKVCVTDDQIREATKVEIENGIKFEPIEENTIVAFTNLFKPNYLLEILKFDDDNVTIEAYQHFTKSTYHLKLDEVRPARLKEKEEGRRINVYNKDMFLSYLNPYMINDIYNIYNHSTDIHFYNTLIKLGIICENKHLTENGERLVNDINFDFLIEFKYDLNTLDNQTTHVTTDKDGTVKEFKLNEGSKPMLDDLNGIWYIVENENEKVISINKAIGMIEYNDYLNSLVKVK